MKILRKFFTVGIAVSGSRILGFIRETFMASTLGIGFIADAFYIAFRFPNLFRRLLAEGILHTSFIPLFSEETKKNGADSAQRLSSEILSVLFWMLLILTVVIELTMPLLVRFVLAPGFYHINAAEYSLVVKLSTIMFPYLMCMSLTALMSGMLFSLGYYFIASISPIFLNIVLIFVMIYATLNQYSAQDAAYLLSWGVLLSGIIQFSVVYFFVKNTGIKILLQYPHITDNVKKFLKITLPIVFTGGIVQINQTVGQAIASGKEGTISSLQYAERIYQLPLGVIGSAIGIILLPELSRLFKEGNRKKIFLIQNRTIEFICFFTIPIVFALCTLSEEIIRVLYERGAFTQENTTIVSTIISIYSLGIPGFILTKALQPEFYARKDTKTPMKFTLISALVNLGLAIILFPFIGGYGIAYAEIIAGWLNTICLATNLLKRKKILLSSKTIYHVLSFLASSGIMWIAIMFLKSYFSTLIVPGEPFINKFKALTIILLSGALIYFVSTILFVGKNFLKLLK
ncbi:murein biosynthesis integral membrane protein MurJ [Candidatus Liberibacter sp.]|uniref:murein biosynthesis integral membrane protein MurJ n=1 Tax=Candidatus Liberibacter sp. TaxID=34022 RepID=UPI0015F42BEE|nr:murein biosynthesis integral membrane protein MurJ [Candidatus Liberibacter sp.]MBA5724267.1 murein biosynthesis integral membrane protein MurJ [Candidatus Liberibacter sp.]